MNNITGIIALLTLSVPGFLLNSVILGKKRVSESLALSWLSGSIIFTLTTFVLSYFLGVYLNLFSSVLMFLCVVFLLLLAAYKSVSFKNIRLTPKFFWLIAILVFIITCFFPVVDWDAVTLFDFRARVLLDKGLIRDVLAITPFRGYPMYTSLLHFWVYITGLWTAMPIYPLFTLSLAAGVYFSLKRLYSRTVLIFIVLACLFAPKIFEHTFIAYSNLPYSVILILGSIYIYLWTKNKRKENLILGIFFSLATFWVRTFPFGFVNLGLILLGFPFFRKKSRIVAASLILLLAICLFIPALAPVVSYLKWAVYGYYTPYWLLFVAFLGYGLLVKTKDWFWQLLFLGNSLLVVIGTYYYYIQNSSYYLSIPDAIQRMTMFFNLVVILFVASFAEKAKLEQH
jgi:hypothetical protein